MHIQIYSKKIVMETYFLTVWILQYHKLKLLHSVKIQQKHFHTLVSLVCAEMFGQIHGDSFSCDWFPLTSAFFSGLHSVFIGYVAFEIQDPQCPMFLDFFFFSIMETWYFSKEMQSKTWGHDNHQKHSFLSLRVGSIS